MVRISKQEERRSRNPHRRRKPSPKTGALKENLPLGFKPHANAVQGNMAEVSFIPKIK